MALEVVWADRALDKLRTILERVSEDRPAAAVALIDRLFDRAAALAAHPQLGRRYEPAPDAGLRELVEGRYRLIYRVDPERAQVQIVAIRHERERELPREELAAEER